MVKGSDISINLINNSKFILFFISRISLLLILLSSNYLLIYLIRNILVYKNINAINIINL